MVQDRKAAAASDIRERILTYELAPGSDLDETSVSTAYGLSRTPLREIFQALQSQGFVRIVANRGAKVAPLDLDTVRALFQTAPLIYSAVTRLAIEHGGDDQLIALRARQAALLDAVEAEDARAAILHNHAFHTLLGDMTHNPYLPVTLGRLLVDHTRLARELFDPSKKKNRKQMRKLCNQQERLVDALEQKNLERALTLMLTHWDVSREVIEKTLQKEPLVADLSLMDD